VRKDEHVKDLTENLGAKYVLNQTSPTFFDDIKALIAELKPAFLFEYVGGDFASKIF